MDRILKVAWVKGQGFIILQIWRVGFDPFSKVPRRNLVWAKLPGLPLELWNIYAMTEIANRIWKFYYWEEGILSQFDKHMVLVLVEVEMGRGLNVELDIR